jgi:hypothetical protein
MKTFKRLLALSALCVAVAVLLYVSGWLAAGAGFIAAAVLAGLWDAGRRAWRGR